VTRLAIAALVVTFASLAHAGPSPAKPAAAPQTDKPPNPDEIADVESQEANLESQEHRKGLTFAVALGGGMTLGDGVGRGGAISIRLGHVATRKTVITFELAGGSAFHRARGSGPDAKEGPLLQDSNFGLFAGAQRYKDAAWIRAAGGITFLVRNAMKDGSGGEAPITGVGGLIGGGYDFARLRYLTIGFEGFGMASASSDGLRAQVLLGLGLAFY
jgi:hypothetical protein